MSKFLDFLWSTPQKINEANAVAIVMPEQKKQRFYCPRMNVHVVLCRMTTCPRYTRCRGSP